MTVLQIGVPKSGNYWLYSILHQVMEMGGIRHKSFVQNHPIYQEAQTWTLNFPQQADMDVFELEPDRCIFRINGVYSEPIHDIDNYISQCTHVWTHSDFSHNSLTVLPKFDKIVYIIRDPRDVVISLSHMIFMPHVQKNYSPPFEKSPETFLDNYLDVQLRAWTQHVGTYLKYRDKLNFHVIFYERLLHSFDAELSKLLEYLNITLPPEAFSHIRENVSFKKMHKENPKHVRKGESGQWKQTFTETQKEVTKKITGRMLKLLHYPVSEFNSFGLPYLSAKINHIHLNDAITQSLEEEKVTQRIRVRVAVSK